MLRWTNNSATLSLSPHSWSPVFVGGTQLTFPWDFLPPICLICLLLLPPGESRGWPQTDLSGEKWLPLCGEVITAWGGRSGAGQRIPPSSCLKSPLAPPLIGFGLKPSSPIWGIVSPPYCPAPLTAPLNSGWGYKSLPMCIWDLPEDGNSCPLSRAVEPRESP